MVTCWNGWLVQKLELVNTLRGLEVKDLLGIGFPQTKSYDKMNTINNNTWKHWVDNRYLLQWMIGEEPLNDEHVENTGKLLLRVRSFRRVSLLCELQHVTDVWLQKIASVHKKGGMEFRRRQRCHIGSKSVQLILRDSKKKMVCGDSVFIFSWQSYFPLQTFPKVPSEGGQVFGGSWELLCRVGCTFLLESLEYYYSFSFFH